MIQHPDGFSWYHSIETTIPTVVTILLYMIASRRKAKKEQKKQHEENQAQISALLNQRKYFPVHRHNEKKGPLSRENMDFDTHLEIT